MDLDNLKSNWKNAGSGKKNRDELLMMTKIKNHPKIKRIRTYLFFDCILIFVFLVIYYFGFDGATKPLWANVLLIVSTVAYIIVRILGWLTLRKPISGENLIKSLVSFQSKLKRMANLTLFTSFLFGSAIISFFSSSIDFTKGKYFMLTGMILSLMLLVYLSSKNWFKRIEGINTILVEFNETTDQ